MEKYHVLVVEDDTEIANAIKIYLQIKGMTFMQEMMDQKAQKLLKKKRFIQQSLIL